MPETDKRQIITGVMGFFEEGKIVLTPKMVAERSGQKNDYVGQVLRDMNCLLNVRHGKYRLNLNNNPMKIGIDACKGCLFERSGSSGCPIMEKVINSGISRN